MKEIKIGNGDILEALKHVADSYAEIQKQKEKEEQNTKEFTDSLRKLAKKHKVFFSGVFIDKDTCATFSHANPKDAVDYGFNDKHQYAHALQGASKDLSESAWKMAFAAGMLIEEHCNEGEESEREKSSGNQ